MVARIPYRPTLRANRVPGDLFRAMGTLYRTVVPGSSRQSLARKLLARLQASGIRYDSRTIRRQLTGQVATVPPAVEAALKEALYEVTGRASDPDIERALAEAGLGVSAERRQPEYVSSDRVTPLAELWLLLNPGRSKRFLARELARALARRGIRTSVDALQSILAGKRPTSRRQVHEELLALLAQHGVCSESEARALRQRRLEEIAAYQQDRVLVSPERFLALVRAWKLRRREPSSRRLAALLRQRLLRRGLRPGLRRVQEAVDGKARRIRAGYVIEIERLVEEALPQGRSLEAALADGEAAATRLRDLRWVDAAPLAALAKEWVEAHPGTTMRQLSLRVARSAHRMGYRLSLNTVQPILGGHKQRTRGFVYRALLRQCAGPGARVPDEHLLPRPGAAQLRPTPARRGPKRKRIGRETSSFRCCGGLAPSARLARRPNARLSREEEAALALRLKAGTQQAAEARSELVAAHQWLVMMIARKYRWQGLELSDLVAEGNIGLLHALDKFDPRRGCRISTYASWWIRSRIELALSDAGMTVRLPANFAGRIRRLRRAANRAYQERGNCLALRDLAADVGLPADDPRALLQLDRGTISIQARVGSSDVTLERFLADDTTVSPPDAATHRELLKRLDQALRTLDPREALVLRMRYGIGDDNTRSLAEVGQLLGVSRERVRQLQDRALSRLRGHAGSRLLGGFLEAEELPAEPGSQSRP